jgi:hypothetical protein
MLFIIAIIAILIEAYLRREAIRGHHRLIIGSSEAHQCQSSQVVAYLRRGAIIGHPFLWPSTRTRLAIRGNHVREDCDPLGDSGNQRQSGRQSEAIREAITYERIAILSETEAAVGADCVPKISPNTSASPAEMTKRTCMQRNQRQSDGHQ